MAKTKVVETTELTKVGIQIPPIDMRKLAVTLVGDSSLIVHAWSEKAKKEMLGKQMQDPKQKRKAKDPWRDFVDSLYWLSDKPETPTRDDVRAATFGFPTIAFKRAGVSACRDSDGIKMTEARGRFHVNGDMVTIDAPTPDMREDMVHIGIDTADLRYRGEFKAWRVILDITYNASAITPAQIVNLLNIAGFGVGVGEWRPEKNGEHGRFHVATTTDELTTAA